MSSLGTLNPDIARIMNENPVTPIIDTLRTELVAAFSLKPEYNDPAHSSELGPEIFLGISRLAGSVAGCKLMKSLRNFLVRLSLSPVAAALTVNPPETLDVDLLKLSSRWSPSLLEYEPLAKWVPLLQSVLASEEVALWESLVDIFLSPQTPSSSVSLTPPYSRSPSNLLQTPIKGHSGSNFLDLGTHKFLDQRLRAELDGLVYPNTPLFLETFFREKGWSSTASQAFERASSNDIDWPHWPAECDQMAVLEWFSSYVNDLLSETPCVFTATPNNPLAVRTSKLKLDLFLHKRALTTTPTWSDVLVVGELQKSNKKTRSPSLIIKLANYIRMIFIQQNRRRFVHAFTVCGDIMRCWIFHRCGGFTSEEFSITKNPELFVAVVFGYSLMSETDLGFDPTLTLAHGGAELHCNITMPGSTTQRFVLEPKPFFTTRAIVSRGTTCWNAKLADQTSFAYVCKDSWRSSAYVSEGDMLAKAQSDGVEGLVEYIAHEDVRLGLELDDVSNSIMKGLEVNKGLYLYPSHDLRTGSSSSLSTLATTDLISAPGSSAAGTRIPGRGQTSLGSIVRKRSGDNNNTSAGSKRVRSPTHSRHSSVPSPTQAPRFNRIHSRLITVKGRPIYNFSSNFELLKAFRDTIRAHRSLLRQGFLHRDISINNLMITIFPRPDKFTGFLIDLDLAIHLNTHVSTSPHRTGTMEYMAIGALCGDRHTYRHDIESFFYVLLWICTHYLPGGKRVNPRPEVFAGWDGPDFSTAGMCKQGNMDKGSFEVLLLQFSDDAEKLKPLAREWRTVLFPIRDGALWTGTDEDPEPLYGKVLGCIANALTDLEEEDL